MATHSSILAWRIPWTEEPGELQSKGYQLCKQLKTDVGPIALKAEESRRRLNDSSVLGSGACGGYLKGPGGGSLWGHRTFSFRG